MASEHKLLAVLACAGLTAVLRCAAQTYSIEHSPVSVSLPGRPLTVRVRLKGDYQSVKAVSLLYAVSQDAAPFRISMRSSGPGIYAATVPGTLLSGVDKVSYYIEAADTKGATRETPWYSVTLRSTAPPAPTGEPTPPEPAKVAPAQPAKTTQPDEEDEGWNWGWKETALLTGGGVVAGGLYLWLDDGDSSSGGGGGDGGGGSSTNSGTYAGTATLNTSVDGSGTTFVTRPVTIAVDDAGHVTSGTLHPGQTLTGNLSGNTFVLVAAVDEEGRSGEIQYIGTVLNDRIVGSIQGSATSAEGAVTYSGSFSANRQS